MHKTAELLKEHNVSSTNIRNKVLNVFLDNDHALAHHDVSEQLDEQVDRVTLYRTLHTFEAAGIVHKIIDAEGISRFALCRECNHEEHYDHHAHFHCKKCGKIFCLDDPSMKQYNIPEGFQLENISVDLIGLCGDCNS
jgi:Fur family ferric uptake transcriptional regulator